MTKREKAMGRLAAWSYSRYTTYRTCPRQAYYKFVARLPEPETPALRRGIAVHDASERYLKGETMGVPEELLRFETRFKALRGEVTEGNAAAEESWALSSSWEPVEFFANDVWLRGKIDAWRIPEDGVLDVIDVKTGKPRDGYGEQLRLYAAMAFSVFDGLERVRAELWYTDLGEVVGGPGDPDAMFDADDAPALRSEWEDKVRPLLRDRRFDPRPGNHCLFCHFSRSRGGPCKY